MSEAPAYEVVVAAIRGRARGMWGVRRFHRAVRVALGPSAVAKVTLAWVALAAPGAWLCAHGPSHAPFVALAAAAAMRGRPNMNLIGCAAWTIAPMIAYAALVLMRGRAGLAVVPWATGYPLVAWFVSGAIRGTTLHTIGQAMVTDRRVYEQLRTARLLVYQGSVIPVTADSPHEE